MVYGFRSRLIRLLFRLPGICTATATADLIPLQPMPMSMLTTQANHRTLSPPLYTSILSTMAMASSASHPSPTNSFYAMSDDEEGDYNTIRHVKTGRGVKLLYTKSKVYAYLPTTSAYKSNLKILT